MEVEGAGGNARGDRWEDGAAPAVRYEGRAAARKWIETAGGGGHPAGASASPAVGNRDAPLGYLTVRFFFLTQFIWNYNSSKCRFDP